MTTCYNTLVPLYKYNNCTRLDHKTKPALHTQKNAAIFMQFAYTEIFMTFFGQYVKP